MIDRREFLKRAGALGTAGLVMAYGLLPDYARAQTVSFTDSRIKATYVEYPSPGGNADKMRGYLVQPAGQGPWPAGEQWDYVQDPVEYVARTDQQAKRPIQGTKRTPAEAKALEQALSRQRSGEVLTAVAANPTEWFTSTDR